ncbi:hypothetical protein BG003_007933 [Podila horticola]|nr:hypothetical protein BG003_007933 [Podila horticola]
MSTQSIMVPPNNAPWPGSSSSTPSSTATPASYPPPYYHHPGHGHPPSPHQAPYYPYHPYPASAYPPYPPSHPHPYHHPHYPPPSTPASTTSSSPSENSKQKSSKVEAHDDAPSKTSQKSANEPSPDATPTAANGPKTFRFEGSISSETYKTTKSFDLAGVNILNRKPLDTRTALDKLQRRRETHNRVERKRRDCINQLVDDLTKLLPAKHLEEATSKCHRVNVLRGAVAHIKFLTESNSDLANSLESIKKSHPELESELAAKVSEEKAKSDEMAMEIDSPMVSTKDEDNEDELDESESAPTNSGTAASASRSTSPSSVSRRTSPSESPRLTPSRIMARPPVIVASAPTPTDKEPRSKSIPVPPISIITTPAEHTEGHSRSISECASPASSYSHSPMFPPTQYPSSSHPSAFPPSPVSPSPSHQSPFSHNESGHDGTSSREQLSPFMHRPASHSPSLPPISSLANLQIQSPPTHSENAGERRPMERSSSPSSRPPVSTRDRDSRGRDTKSSHRTGSTLPPLMIPSEQHLHPSYVKGNEKSERAPVSPFMLSPSMPRSPSSGPSTGAPPSPYAPPHWGHEGQEGHPPPPPPPPHYMPPHGYPGYPYPYPYHPSYGYPPHHPHPPPPQASPPSMGPNRHLSLQPEPIFIQEEPWVVQRKRSTSNAASKPSSTKAQARKSKTSKDDDDEAAPLSPSSVTSSIASFQRKRPSPQAKADFEEAKRPKQRQDKEGVEEGDKEGEADQDAAQALTSLAQNS